MHTYLFWTDLPNISAMNVIRICSEPPPYNNSTVSTARDGVGSFAAYTCAFGHAFPEGGTSRPVVCVGGV